MSKRPPIVSSLSMSFKRATNITEDREEAKREHRESLKTLVDKYFEDLQAGKVDGIRNAKELVEVIKMDLLLMGEATERTENTNELDEIRIQKISQALDLNDDKIKEMVADVFMTLNNVNDEADVGNNKKTEAQTINDEKGISLLSDNDALMELANQAMNQYVQDSMEDDNKEEE